MQEKTQKRFTLILLLLFVGIIFGLTLFIYFSTLPLPASPITKNGCIVGGCSGELCLDELSKETVSICIYRPEWVCYKTAKCERQGNGKCGWRETQDLKRCLSSK